MFGLVSGFYESLQPPELRILIVGLDGAGKTSLFERLKVTNFDSGGRGRLTTNTGHHRGRLNTIGSFRPATTTTTKESNIGGNSSNSHRFESGNCLNNSPTKTIATTTTTTTSPTIGSKTTGSTGSIPSSSKEILNKSLDNNNNNNNILPDNVVATANDVAVSEKMGLLTTSTTSPTLPTSPTSKITNNEFVNSKSSIINQQQKRSSSLSNDDNDDDDEQEETQYNLQKGKKMLPFDKIRSTGTLYTQQ